MKDIKQIIIINKDVEMSPAKIAIQVAHASQGAMERIAIEPFKAWKKSGRKKVVLTASLEDIVKLYDYLWFDEETALSLFLAVEFGLTEVPVGTITALGIGPDLSEEIDKFTKKFTLYKG